MLFLMWWNVKNTKEVIDGNITVTSQDGNKTATCEIVVSERFYPVTGVSLNKSSTKIPKCNKNIIFNVEMHSSKVKKLEKLWKTHKENRFFLKNCKKDVDICNIMSIIKLY